jgi:hypothetical protein
MLIRHRRWRDIANTRTKRSSVISVLRWTLLRHATQSLNHIDDEQTKKTILREEMSWLNRYWAQAVPKSDLPLKYWQRLFNARSLDVRRDYYE